MLGMIAPANLSVQCSASKSDPEAEPRVHWTLADSIPVQSLWTESPACFDSHHRVCVDQPASLPTAPESLQFACLFSCRPGAYPFESREQATSRSLSLRRR